MPVSVGSVSFDVGRGRAMGNGDGMTVFWYYSICRLWANQCIVQQSALLQYGNTPWKGHMTSLHQCIAALLPHDLKLIFKGLSVRAICYTEHLGLDFDKPVIEQLHWSNNCFLCVVYVTFDLVAKPSSVSMVLSIQCLLWVTYSPSQQHAIDSSKHVLERLLRVQRSTAFHTVSVSITKVCLMKAD